MSERTDFLKYVATQVTHYEKVYSVNTGKAFSIWYGVEGFGLDDDAAYEASQADGPNDKSIDFFHVDQEHERVLILQGKFRARGDYRADEGELLKLLSTTTWLDDPEALRRDGRPDLADAAEDYLSAIAAGYSVEYTYCFLGPEHQESDTAADRFNQDSATRFPVRQARVMDVYDLNRLHGERVSETRIPTETLSILPLQSFGVSGVFGESLVASVGGEQLQRLYRTHGDALFDRNIRLYLGARSGGVNAGIRDTLDSPKARKNFWAFNNGITIVCDSFDLDEKNGKLEITNFSVVNGCQTTTSIGKASATAAKDVSLLMRVIQAVDPVIDDIIRFNNSQTPIYIWEFSSQDPLQRRLKDELAEGDTPFLYVLRKGEKQTLTEEERARFRRDGALQQIPHDLLTQYLASFDGLPTVAYKDKARLFDTLRPRLYPESTSVEKILLVWQLGVQAEEAVREAIREAVEEENEIALRILKKGAKMFVVAVASMILSKRNGKSYVSNVARAVAQSKATSGRLLTYATVAATWYVDIVTDLIRDDEELGTVVRSEEAFARIAQKVNTMWKTYAVNKAWVKALPAL